MGDSGMNWPKGRTRNEGRFVKFFISISGSFGAECDKLPFGDWKRSTSWNHREREREGKSFEITSNARKEKESRGKQVSDRVRGIKKIQGKWLRVKGEGDGDGVWGSANRYSAFRGQLSAKSFAFRLVGTTNTADVGGSEEVFSTRTMKMVF